MSETPSCNIHAARELAARALNLVTDPNAITPTGQYPLPLAISLCFDGDGEKRVAELLSLGADPNVPDPWSNFTLLLTTTNNIDLVSLLIESGLQLNKIYRTSRESGHLTDGDVTILDYAYAVADYVDKKHVLRNALAKQCSSSLRGRRHFIFHVILLLERSGARRAQK